MHARDKARKFTADLDAIRSSTTSMSYREVGETLDLVLATCKLPVVVKDYHGDQILRGRSHAPALPIQSVSELSYIPPSKSDRIITSFGRANKPGESVFYGSVSHRAASSEILSANGKAFRGSPAHLTIGMWSITQPLKLIGMLFPDDGLDPTEPPHGGIKHWNESIEHEIRNTCDSDEQAELAMASLRFFSNVFGAKSGYGSRVYLISNYYKDFALFRESSSNGQVDGIMYPSVAHSLQYSNIALFPSAVDSKLAFQHAGHVCATLTQEQAKMRFETIEWAKADSQGLLHWGDGQAIESSAQEERPSIGMENKLGRALTRNEERAVLSISRGVQGRFHSPAGEALRIASIEVVERTSSGSCTEPDLRRGEGPWATLIIPRGLLEKTISRLAD